MFKAQGKKLLTRGDNMKIYIMLRRISLRKLCTLVYLHLSKRYDGKYGGRRKVVALGENRPNEGGWHTEKSAYARKYPSATQGVIGLFPVIILLISKSAGAAGSMGPVPNNSSPQTSVYKVYTAHGGHSYHLRLRNSGPGSSPIDYTSEKCIEVRGVIKRGLVADQNVIGWGTVVKEFLFSLGYSLTLINQCTYSVSTYLALWSQSDPSIWIGEQIYLPGRDSCSASIRDVELGELFTNTTKKLYLSISKSGSGYGTVKVRGKHISSGGDLYLGGDEKVIVRPTANSNVSTENGKSIWVSSWNQRDIPLEVTVGNTSKSGEKTSILTATLTCQ